MGTTADSTQDSLQFKNIFALSLLPAIALAFPVLLFFKFQRYWSWVEFHIYIAFGVGLLFSLLIKRVPWGNKFLAISAPATTYLLFLYFNIGNPFTGVDYVLLVIFYAQILTHVGLGFFLFSAALKATPPPSSPGGTKTILASVSLGLVVGASILYIGYLSWSVGYLVAGMIPGVAVTVWFWRSPAYPSAINPPLAEAARPTRARQVLTFLVAVFGTMILVAVLVLLGGTDLGLLARQAASVGYFDRILDSNPDYLFNYYGLPSTLLVGGGVVTILLAIVWIAPKLNVAFPFILLLGGCWGYSFLQELLYRNVLPSPTVHLLLGIPLALVFCAILQWSQSRWFQSHDLNRAVLYLVAVLALGLGLILPSDSGAITNLGDNLYLLLAEVPALAATIILLLNLIIKKIKGRPIK